MTDPSSVGTPSATQGASANATGVIPTGVTTGDIIFAWISSLTAAGGGGWSTPAGWTNVNGNQALGAPTSPGYCQLIQKPASPADSGATLAVPLGTSQHWSMVIIAYTNVDPVNPIVSGGQPAFPVFNTATTHASPAATIASAGFAVYFVTDRGSPPTSGTPCFTSPGLASKASITGAPGTGAFANDVLSATASVGAGTIASATFTSASASSQPGLATIVVLKPASVVSTGATITAYPKAVQALLQESLAGSAAGNFHMWALGAGYSPDFVNHDHFDDVSGELGTGNGYTSGGANATSPSVGYDTSTGYSDLTSAAFTVNQAPGETFAPRYLLFGIKKASSATSTLLVLLDFGSVQAFTGGVTINADAVLGWLYGYTVAP